jgi:hypothetical protein
MGGSRFRAPFNRLLISQVIVGGASSSLSGSAYPQLCRQSFLVECANRLGRD